MTCAGCSSGSITIDLEVPQIAALNPLAPAETARLSTFRLQRDADGHPIAETRFAPGDSLSLGKLPAGTAVDMDIEGLAESGQILAFGRMRQVAIKPDEDVSVTVLLRKPIGYVSGGASVLVRDTTKSDPPNPSVDLSSAANATAVTSTNDGSAVLLAVGSAVKAVSTADHKDIPSTLNVGEAATALVVDPTDHTLAVLSPRGVTLFPIGGWLAGTQSEVMGVTMSPASPVAAAFSNDGALLWVVTGSANCSGGCVVHGIDVANAKEAGQQMLPEYASDIAVERASDSPVVALPGRGALVWVDKGSGSLTQTQSAQPDATLVVSNGSAVVGFAGGDTRINSDCMAPGAQQKPSAMVVLPGQPARKVDIQIPEFTGTFSTDPTAANQAIAQVTSAQVTINHAAVTPDAGRALIWATINYCGDINVSGGSGLRLCSGRVQARHEDVMLIDLASGVPISAQTTQESVMQCDLDCGILGTLTCSPVTSLPPQQFVPTGISILFGGK